MKLTKEALDKVRHIEGFPIGEDEDIIALSDPPYYTACPNPFIKDFIEKHGTPYDEDTDDYKREPFAADVSEGKNDPIYMAHSYHTKVPHKAVMKYILHYTKPGDIIFDGFCGTGMTGVAAQMCGNPDADLEFKYKLETEMPGIKWGARKAILSDLSPAATFIAYNYNTPIDIIKFEKEAKRILEEYEEEFSWMYETNHVDENGNQIHDITGPAKGKINYTVWSDVLICPNCGEEIIFWDVAMDKETQRVKKIFECDNCKMELKKTDCNRAIEMVYDGGIGETISMTKQVPVLINYLVDNKRFEKRPDKADFDLIKKIDSMEISYWYPTDRMLQGSESRRNDKFGITHVHHFYTRRTNYVLAVIHEKFKNNSHLLFYFTSIIQRASKLFRWSKNQAGPLSGTLYIASSVYETSVFSLLNNKSSIFNAWNISTQDDSIINTSSLTDMSNIPNNSIDYIFTDPPFGANLNYSELSFIWEAWLKVFTDNESEAIMNRVQGKGLLEYQELMHRCFAEYYRVLKPNRWMTVEFHNSQNSVWNAIQESLLRAGFIIADVRTLDKKQGSFKQVTTTSAVKQDLVISAYKPKENFKNNILEKAGSEETAWDFVREHLDKLPVVVKKNDSIEIIKEREPHLLFDRMVAYHIMAGIAVPIDAADFYKGLDERFLKRDGMYFLHDQINEYDKVRIVSELDPIQFDMFVNDEKSAISWLYHQLETPQTYGDIQPKFMKEVNAARYEILPELGELLAENFLQEDDGIWYIPDPTKAGDLIKLREKKLLKEFEEYLTGKVKLTQVRTEAIRVGFSKLYGEGDYGNIVKVGDRLPYKVIQEDDKLLMYYDMALSRLE